MNRLYMALMFLGTFFTAISQILLKQSANRTWKNPLSEYLNVRVIVAYAFFFGVLLLNTWAYTKVDMKYGSIIDTCSYIFVMLLSRWILKEHFSRGKLIGNLVILTGIFLYTLPL
ncbi:MAG: EamA family transporter [Clostridiales bacterium]|nr:EamA family transporter [Clostridiales bacterium]